MNYVTRVPEAGNYTFLSEFKCGIYNRCWKAINKVTNDIVIVRTIPKIDLVKHENKSKMANEITLLKNSCHPLISKFIELIDLPKEFHIIMTEPKGISLREYIDKNCTLEEKLGQELVKKLFTIAQYLKSTLGLEYCAFSPDSIFVDEKGHLVNYFIQFYEPMNNSLLLQSNAAFNPPEILTSKGVFSSSDSWSISCILNYCLTGKIPFQKENVEETVQSILNDQFDIDDDISDNAKNFIYCGLIKNPLMRTQFKAIMSTKFMEGIPLEMMATKKSAATQSYSPKTLPSTIGKKQLIRISYKSFIPEVKKSYRTRSGTTFW